MPRKTKAPKPSKSNPNPSMPSETAVLSPIPTTEVAEPAVSLDEMLSMFDPSVDLGMPYVPMPEIPVVVAPQPLPPGPIKAPAPAVEPDALPPGFRLVRRAATLGEVFTQVASYPSQVEKAAWLAYNASAPLYYLLHFAFTPGRVWRLPPGLPPYTPHRGRPGSAPSDLRRELRRLYLFIQGGHPTISQVKVEKLFQQVAEGLDPEEVVLLAAIKDHTMVATFGVTEALVERAFPGLLATDIPLKFIR